MLQPRTNQRQSWGTRCIQIALSGLVALTAVLVACSSPPANTPASPAPTSATPAAPVAPTVGVLPASPTLAATTAPSPVATSATAPLTAVPTRPPATTLPTAVPTAVSSPVAIGPTPVCVQPTLTLGTTKFRIESIARAADGSVAVPSNTTDVAYWVQGGPATYVFALSAVPNNLALKTKLKAGDPAMIVWGDCSTEDYVVKAVESGEPNVAKLFDPSAARVNVFVQTSGLAEGFVVKAGRPEPPVQATAVPTEANPIEMDVAFQGTKASADSKTLEVNIAITNTGTNSIALTTKDISLAVENSVPVAPLGVEPALPQEIKPKASASFRVTFPKPAGHTAVFKLLDLTVDILF